MSCYNLRDCNNAGDAIDDGPGHYYVSAIDAGRLALVAGPYPTHREALDQVDKVQALAEECDPRAIWYSFGTSRTEHGTARGVLNERLGLA